MKTLPLAAPRLFDDARNMQRTPKGREYHLKFVNHLLMTLFDEFEALFDATTKMETGDGSNGLPWAAPSQARQLKKDAHAATARVAAALHAFTANLEIHLAKTDDDLNATEQSFAAMNHNLEVTLKAAEDHKGFPDSVRHFLATTQIGRAMRIWSHQRLQMLMNRNPVLQVREDVAISLMMTDCPPELLPELDDLPWPSFRLVLPPKLVVREGDFGGGFLRQLEIGRLNDAEIVLMFGSPGEPRFEIFRRDGLDELVAHPRQDVRAVGLLVVGLVFLLHQSEGREIIERAPAREVKRYRKEFHEKDSAPQIYFANPAGIWGADLKAEREFLADKLARRKYRAPRWLRRGHWRLQGVGAGRLEKKLVRVAPSWCHRHELTPEERKEE